MATQYAFAQTFFESTWATALGRSDNAVRDGGNWDLSDGNGSYVNVKSISGPGLPVELANLNMATVSMNGDQGWQMVVENVNTNTASDFYYRFYVRVKPAIGFQYAQLHPWQDYQSLPDGLTNNFYIGISSVNASTWRPAFWTTANLLQAPGMPRQFGVLEAAFGGPEPQNQLQVNQWYRIEGHLRYLNRVNPASGPPYAETIYTLRIYDSQNQQVMSNDDFRGELCDATGCTYDTLPSYYDQGQRFRFRATSSTFTMGVNSPAGASGQAEIYDMTAIAFSNTDWLGPYIGAGGATDTEAPTVTLNKAVGQADPTSSNIARFTMSFSEPINVATLTRGDIVLSGTSGVITQGPFSIDNRNFEFSVTGLRSNDEVVARLPQNRVRDLVGNLNEASTHSDNSVRYRCNGCVIDDQDNDGIDDAQDSCPVNSNPGQQDDNNNGTGDACEDDKICLPIRTHSGSVAMICL